MRLSAHLLLHEAMTTSASRADFQKAVNNFDLISSDQGWCMAAVLHGVCRGISVSA